MSWMDKRKEHGTGGNGFEPLPKGDYVVEVTKASLGPTKAKDGKILTLELTVISEAFQNRKIFCRLNVENPNPTAERIGLEQLNQLIECSGMTAEPKDENDLVGLTVGAHLKIRTQEGYDPDNEVSYFKKAADCKLSAPSQAAAPAKAWEKKDADKKKTPAPAAPTAPARKPWEKA